MKNVHLAVIAATVVLVVLAGIFLSPMSGNYLVEPDPLVRKAQFHTGNYDSSSENVSITVVNTSA